MRDLLFFGLGFAVALGISEWVLGRYLREVTRLLGELTDAVTRPPEKHGGQS